MQDLNSEQKILPSKDFFNYNIKSKTIIYVISVVVLTILLYQLMGGFITFAVSGFKTDEIDVKNTRIILVITQFIFILTPAVIFARLKNNDIKSVFKLYSPKPVLLLLSIIGIILLQPFLQGSLYLQDLFINSIPFLKSILDPAKEIFSELEKKSFQIVNAHNWFEFLVVVFVISVSPSLCEEALFRGFALSNLSLVLKPVSAILITGFIFAVGHFQPFNIIPLTIIGIFLGFIVYYSNSIFTAVVAHFLNNFMASYYYFRYGKPDIKAFKFTQNEILDILISSAVSLFLFVLILYIFYKNRFRPVNIQSSPGGNN